MHFLAQPSSIKNIIFDFGGVLFDIDYEAPIRAFKSLGLKDFEQHYHKSQQSTLFDDIETGKISNEEFIREIATLLPASVSDQEILEAWNSILIGMKSNRLELLRELSKKYKLYLLSNTNAMHVEAFEKILDNTIGLAEFKSLFQKVYYSNEIGLKKPSPNTFKEVCEWNGIKPNETLFIDDSPQHVDGAISAGLNAYHLELSEENVIQFFEAWSKAH